MNKLIGSFLLLSVSTTTFAEVNQEQIVSLNSNILKNTISKRVMNKPQISELLEKGVEARKLLRANKNAIQNITASENAKCLEKSIPGYYDLKLHEDDVAVEDADLIEQNNERLLRPFNNPRNYAIAYCKNQSIDSAKNSDLYKSIQDSAIADWRSISARKEIDKLTSDIYISQTKQYAQDNKINIIITDLNDHQYERNLKDVTLDVVNYIDSKIASNSITINENKVIDSYKSDKYYNSNIKRFPSNY